MINNENRRVTHTDENANRELKIARKENAIQIPNVLLLIPATKWKIS